MIAVVIPGLIISLLGMYFVSQQKRERELNAAKELTDRMNFVRDRIENQTLQSIKTVFQTLSNSKENIDYGDANNVMTHIKRLVLAYVYHAIGCCYFRMGKYPQALHYYRRVLDQFPIQLEKDKSLHFLVLRQIALFYTFRGCKREALNSYLDLYEKVLGYELSKKSNPFEFFKNEALAYLNRHVQQYAAEKERFSRARQRDRLSNASQLDISLGWL